LNERSSSPPIQNQQLAYYWDKPVSELATIPEERHRQEEVERHRILSLLVMALIAAFWNGNKRGQLPNVIYVG
jgi:hypothetical protein